MIAVVDHAETADALARIVRSQSVDGRGIVVRAVGRVADAGDADALYVPGPRVRIAEAARATAGRPVLLVAADPDGLEAGAAINFVLERERIRFDVSLPAAARAGLALRAPLLSVARRVEGARPIADANHTSALTPRVDARDPSRGR